MPDDIARIRVPNSLMNLAIGPIRTQSTGILPHRWDQSTGTLHTPASLWSCETATSHQLRVTEAPTVRDLEDARAHWSRDFRAGRHARGLAQPCPGGTIFVFSGGMVGYVGGGATAYVVEERGAVVFHSTPFVSLDHSTVVVGADALAYPVPNGELNAIGTPGSGQWSLYLTGPVTARLMKAVQPLVPMEMAERKRWLKDREAPFATGYESDLRALGAALQAKGLAHDIRWEAERQALVDLSGGWLPGVRTTR